MGELLPCPFCGSSEVRGATYSPVDGEEWQLVVCTSCGAETNDCATKAEAIAAWNRRADLGETVQRAWQVAEQARREAADLRGQLAEYEAEFDNAVNQAILASGEAKKALRERAEKAEAEAAELRAERAQLLETIGQAVHGHSGAGTLRGDLPACEAAGWGMW